MTVSVYPQISVQPPGNDLIDERINGGGNVTISSKPLRRSVTIYGSNIPTVANIQGGYVGQTLWVQYKQGPTPSALTFGSAIVLGSVSYTSTNTAGARDVMKLLCLDGFNWGLILAVTGFTV